MALVEPVFLDTSVLIAGLIEIGSASDSAQRVLDAVAERRLKRVLSAWHCCLEFYAVSTRLPPELRLTPSDALRLLEEEVMARLEIFDLPARARARFLRIAAEQDRVTGGRIYDAHIAEIARLSGSKTIVTDNPRHFISLLRQGIRVMTTSQFVEDLLK